MQLYGWHKSAFHLAIDRPQLRTLSDWETKNHESLNQIIQQMQQFCVQSCILNCISRLIKGQSDSPIPVTVMLNLWYVSILWVLFGVSHFLSYFVDYILKCNMFPSTSCLSSSFSVYTEKIAFHLFIIPCLFLSLFLFICFCICSPVFVCCLYSWLVALWFVLSLFFLLFFTFSWILLVAFYCPLFVAYFFFIFKKKCCLSVLFVFPPVCLCVFHVWVFCCLTISTCVISGFCVISGATIVMNKTL